MAGLAIMYSKELIRELDMIPVYYPGTSVKPGDVLTFKHNNIFGKPQPVGSFKKEASLTDYFDIETEIDSDPDPIRFASQQGVSIDFDADVDVGSLGKGRLNINFSKSGSLYMVAAGMKQERIKNTEKLKSNLVRIKNKFTGDWSKSFIVISVRVAERSMSMQSNSANGSLVIDGNAKFLQPGSVGPINASLKIGVSAYKDASFMKDWSPNVEVFMGLSRFRKKFSGSWSLGHGFAPSRSDEWELSSVYPDEVDFSE